jgi:hypothetical protein
MLLFFFLPANTDRLGSFAYRANARLGALAISGPYSLKRAHSLVARPGRLAHDSRALVALDAMCRPSPTTGLVHPVQVLDRTNRLGIDRSGPGASWKGKGHDVQLPWGVAERCLVGRARIAGGPWSITDTWTDGRVRGYGRVMTGPGLIDRWMIDHGDDDGREISLWAHAARNIGRVS